MNKSVIIVAGGKGLRMNSEVPKQFMEIGGKPILMHTLERFYDFLVGIKIVLVLPASQIKYWKKLCEEYNFNIPHNITEGGETRFFSVKNGLEKVDTEYVAIHDGVRPLVSFDTLKRCFDEVETNDGIIPVVDLIDSVRFAEDFENSKPVDRNCYKLVQTPQIFSTNVVRKSYQLPYSEIFTDDASVVESAGYKVKLVEGNRENIKITTEMDLKIAETFLKLK